MSEDSLGYMMSLPQKRGGGERMGGSCLDVHAEGAYLCAPVTQPKIKP